MDLVDHLTAIGFTEYEAKVYLALLRDNPATGYQIGKAAGVPRSMVYEALGRLHVRGAVLKTEEAKGALYRPVSPDVLIDRYEEEQRRITTRLREGLRPLFSASDEDHFWSMTGRASVLSHAAEMIEGADEEVMLVIADRELEYLRAVVEAACGRGIEVSALLTGSDTLACSRVAHHPPAESELQELTDTLVVVCDRREVLIATTTPETSAAVTSNRNLVFIARQFVWMELFAQRIYARLGADLMAKLDEEDRRIFEDIAGTGNNHGSR